MSNTTTASGNTITITGLDADWYLSNDLPFYKDTGLCIESISVKLSTMDDTIRIENSADGSGGAYLMDTTYNENTDRVVEHFHGSWLFPFIDISDCSLAVAANASVTINLK